MTTSSNIFLLLVLCLQLIGILKAQGTKKFYIEKTQWCESLPVQQVKFYITPKSYNERYQIIDANFSLPKPLGDNYRLKLMADLEVKLDTNLWVRLFVIESDFCQLLKRYIGGLINDFQRAAAIPPGICPWPQGNYHIQNHRMEFSKLRIQSLPFGRIKVQVEMMEKSTKEKVFCMVIYGRNLED